MGAKPAFDDARQDRRAASRAPTDRSNGLQTVPYVCLRLPTGGGKTLLSAHTAKIAADAYLEREFPIVLWLVPTNTIRAQTLETLQEAGQPQLRNACAPPSTGAFACSISPTSFRSPPPICRPMLASSSPRCRPCASPTRTGARSMPTTRIWSRIFPPCPPTQRGWSGFEDGDHKGQIKFSFRNLLALHRPLVIVDEAHNNTSALSYEVLQRVNAACVVEFTATPADDSNVLHNVSATELKAEDMIKLPIRLTEHKSWEDAVGDSILTRQRLHDVAAKDADYIRPIILFQAEEKGREVTKEILLKHLLEQQRIPREKIAVVTGDQKELDGINLFARGLPD